MTQSDVNLVAESRRFHRGTVILLVLGSAGLSPLFADLPPSASLKGLGGTILGALISTGLLAKVLLAKSGEDEGGSPNWGALSARFILTILLFLAGCGFFGGVLAFQLGKPYAGAAIGLAPFLLVISLVGVAFRADKKRREARVERRASV